MKVILTLFMFASVVISEAKTVLKFKLEWADGKYTGTMSPKWFDRIELVPAGTDRQDLENATGEMTGERFGSWDFIIVSNNVSTDAPYMIKLSNGWYPLSIEFKGNKLLISFDWMFRPEPNETDLRVLKEAYQLLDTPDSWNNEDDRKCEDDFSVERWSLYCVLKRASIDVTGDFNHRGASLNIVRQQISDQNPERKYQHQLMDFNNEETFQEIRNTLNSSIMRMEQLLKDR